jgi:hypothetical protein
MHDLFVAYETAPIGDIEAASITATLGTKGPAFFTCEQDFSE